MALFHLVQIGNLKLGGNVFLAPVAGYSDASFRSICVDFGSAFTYTEMVSSEAIVRKNLKTDELMKRAKNEKSYAVQIFGSDENVMAEAAKIVVEKTGSECIDINCGCPVPKIVKTGAGSALMREPEKIEKIVRAIWVTLDSLHESEKAKTAISVKIRSGWDENNITFREAAMAAINGGVDAITLHARTRSQGYEGKADWAKLAELVELAKRENEKVQVFGSGDLFSPEDAKKMLSETGCDGVMFARGAMGNPFIFAKTIQYLQTGKYDEFSAEERIKTGFRELEMLASERGEKSACLEMRKRFCAYSKGISGGAAIREKLVHAETMADYREIFGEA